VPFFVDRAWAQRCHKNDSALPHCIASLWGIGHLGVIACAPFVGLSLLFPFVWRP
jgi:hypothetical protein